MTYEERIKLVNDKEVNDVMLNLYFRWEDEGEYEDINDYGKIISSRVGKALPNREVKFIKGTKRPFGAKMKIDGKGYHVFYKKQGRSLTLCLKAEF